MVQVNDVLRFEHCPYYGDALRMHLIVGILVGNYFMNCPHRAGLPIWPMPHATVMLDQGEIVESGPDCANLGHGSF
ncbi:hypothetical protein TSH64_01255 [Azospirillum sp. TSH64]|nr:hypothetical protein TSH64_02150 [Azospirillum sp. TSH64]PWC81149.1 hypothetical protein TSH64_01255 [Azospirillum sp. TSH64]